MPRRFRIHPSIGVARLGNAPEEFFVGPEQPGIPANWEGAGFGSFRDVAGRIKRQAARFHLFEYVADGNGGLRPEEVHLGGEVADVEWRVQIANRKSSFFTFNGQSGAADVYAGRAASPANAPEGDDNPPRFNRRNSTVPTERRQELLEIDPGEKTVSKDAPGPVVLTNPNRNIPFITDLGEIRMDDDGRLVVLGGHGRSGSTDNPPRVIDQYANNDTWFDDVGDGPVKARVILADGTAIDADAAWVIVGPPDFAPSVNNAVTLYDLLWDLAVRELPASTDPADLGQNIPGLALQRQAWHANGGQSLAGYTPSFVREIYPILLRAVQARDLHEPFEMDLPTYHRHLLDWDELARVDAGDPLVAALREYVFSRIRNPHSARVEWKEMPRGLGDDYDSLDGTPKPTALFSLTKVQYALLEQWSKGTFTSDWPGAEPAVPAPTPPTPTGLDRAGLETCVGGPFFPGIEVSWLIRRPELYVAPFRLDAPREPAEGARAPKMIGVLPFIAGFFSQQMAQPWQADFYDCQKEEREGGDHQRYYYMWWTAQRPDDTYAPGVDAQQPWVRHLVPPGQSMDVLDGNDGKDRFKFMVENWPNLPFVLPDSGRGKLTEEPR